MADRQHDSQDSGFLCLPREIRAAIYEDVLRSDIKPPKHSKHFPSRSRETLNHFNVFYPQGFSPPSTILLLVCKDIHDEVQHLSAIRQKQGRLICKLDLMVTDSQGIHSPDIWPAWTQLPKLRSQEQHDLIVDLRLFDVTAANPLFRANGWPGIITQPLMVILNRLLAYGPQFLGPVQGVDDPGWNGLRIHTLTMSIQHCVTGSDQHCLDDSSTTRRTRADVRRTAFSYIYGWMKDLEAQGLLFGHMVEMKLFSGQAQLENSVSILCKEGDELIKKEWESCGYGWGLDPNAFYRCDKSR